MRQGIIMAKREYRPELIPISFTKKSTRKFNPITDIGLDGNGVGARVGKGYSVTDTQ